MVRATHRKMDQPPEARPGVVTTPRWSAAGRRPSPIARRGRAPQGAHFGRFAALHSLGMSGGEREYGVTRALKNRASRALAV